MALADGIEELRLKEEIKTESVRVRFSQDELRQVQVEAQAQGRTVSGYLRWCWTVARRDDQALLNTMV